MEKKPAKFLLKNSKGHPDFVMTMLVAVILCLFIVLLYWMMLNLIGIQMIASATESHSGAVEAVSTLLSNFNDNSQIIIIGICSSVFSLAGSYYLRRASFDKHYIEKKKVELEVVKSTTTKNVGLAGTNDSSIGLPHFDDEEEDI